MTFEGSADRTYVGWGLVLLAGMANAIAVTGTNSSEKGSSEAAAAAAEKLCFAGGGCRREGAGVLKCELGGTILMQEGTVVWEISRYLSLAKLKAEMILSRSSVSPIKQTEVRKKFISLVVFGGGGGGEGRVENIIRYKDECGNPSPS